MESKARPWTFPNDAIGHVAETVCRKVENRYPILGPTPSDYLSLIDQLLEMLLSAGCNTTPAEAVAYVNLQRRFRVKRIARIVGRMLHGVCPDLPPAVAGAVVEEIVYQCRICSLTQMTMYSRLVQVRLQANVGRAGHDGHFGR